tara:strand:- start:115 stop:984 length:870 start_codon:yes stop_codon:yes gene_type:complete
MISSCQLEYPHLTKRKLIITKSGIFTTSLALPDVESEVEMDPEVLVLVLSELLVLSLDKGAEVDRAEKDGVTPLYVSCKNGHFDAARLLLDNGAEVDRANKDGATPLFVACCNGHVDAARLLLDKGADASRVTKKGTTPLGIARKKGHSSIVALLEEHLESTFALHAAARTGDVDAMTQLLEGEAVVDAKKDGATPLFVACEKGHVNAAKLLLDKGAEIGAEIDRAKEDGTTTLWIACFEGRVDAARLLLDNGAEVDRRCSRRRAKLRNHKRERALKDVYKVTPGISLV